jgi:predicted phage-related endonuclease
MSAMTSSERQLWTSWRRSGVTATDVARAVTGYYGSVYAVVDEKLNDLVDDEPTAAMQRGLDAEDAIAATVEAMTGFAVVNRQLWAEHPDRPEFRCTLDGELAEHADAVPVAVLESKTVGQHVTAPHEYFVAQVNWQLLVRGRTRGIIARGDYVNGVDDTEVLVGIHLDPVDADPELQEQLIAVADRILSHVAAGTLPAPDGKAFTSELLKARYQWVDPAADAPALGHDVEDLLDERVDVVARLAELEERKAEIDNTVKALLGTARTAIGSRWKATWSQRTSLDLAALRSSEHAELVEKCSRTETTVDLAALAAELGTKAAKQYRTIPAGRGGLTITKLKEK